MIQLKMCSIHIYNVPLSGCIRHMLFSIQSYPQQCFIHSLTSKYSLILIPILNSPITCFLTSQAKGTARENKIIMRSWSYAFLSSIKIIVLTKSSSSSFQDFYSTSPYSQPTTLSPHFSECLNLYLKICSQNSLPLPHSSYLCIKCEHASFQILLSQRSLLSIHPVSSIRPIKSTFSLTSKMYISILKNQNLTLMPLQQLPISLITFISKHFEKQNLCLSTRSQE